MTLGAYAGLFGFSAAGAGLNVLASNASSRTQYKYQSRLQEQAARLNYDYGIKGLEESPTAQRKGLESAGYNPMLAVQNATAGANAGWTTTGQAQNVDYGNQIANAIDIQNIKNQTEQTASTIDVNDATSENLRAEARNKSALNPYIAPKAKAEIANIEQDTVQKSALVDNMKARLELDRQLGFMGLDVQKRGQDLSYNAQTYASNINRENNIRTNRTTRGKVHGPLGIGFTFGSNKRSNDWYYDMR